jgi:hypothetical protein
MARHDTTSRTPAWARILAGTLLIVGFGGGVDAGDTRLPDVEAALRIADYDTAAKALEAHAKKGVAEAQYRLAGLYRTGRGVTQNDAHAFQWMRSAAEQGHAAATEQLGMMLRTGRGVAPDEAQARQWLQRAAQSGSKTAARALAEGPSKNLRAAASARPRDDSGWRTTVSPRKPEAMDQARQELSRRIGWPPLLDAAWRGRTDTVISLIAGGADVHAADPQAGTALVLAAASGQAETVEALVEAGARTDAHDAAGQLHHRGGCERLL